MRGSLALATVLTTAFLVTACGGGGGAGAQAKPTAAPAAIPITA